MNTTINNKGLNMFLVPTFCEIIKNGPYILKMVQKNPENIPLSKIVHAVYFILVSKQIDDVAYGGTHYFI
jgi:hypothetical protein